MKKQFLLVIFLMSIAQILSAQANTINTTGKFGSQIFLSDVYGRDFENKYADISGSAYLFSDYKNATIILSDGRKYNNIRAKLNLVEHEVVFKSTSGEEGFIGKGMVSVIVIDDSTNKALKITPFKVDFLKWIINQIFIFIKYITMGKPSY